MPRSVCSWSVASRSDACQTPALEIISRSPSSSVVIRMISGVHAAEQALAPVEHVRRFDQLRRQPPSRGHGSGPDACISSRRLGPSMNR